MNKKIVYANDYLSDTFSLDMPLRDDTNLTFGDLAVDEDYDLEEEFINGNLHNE